MPWITHLLALIVAKYMARHPKEPSQTWRTFLANHCHYGLHLPAGEYLFLVKDCSSDAGSFELGILPPLQRWTNNNVKVLGHAGDPLFFVMGTKLAAPSNPFPGLTCETPQLSSQACCHFQRPSQGQWLSTQTNVRR